MRHLLAVVAVFVVALTLAVAATAARKPNPMNGLSKPNPMNGLSRSHVLRAHPNPMNGLRVRPLPHNFGPTHDAT